METIIDKLALIHIENEKVLMTRSKGKDVFYFPGGKRKIGESDENAIVREIREELGVELIPETLNYVATFKTQAHGKPKGTMLQTAYYKGKFVGQPQPLSEIEAIGFYDSSIDPSLLTDMGKLVFAWLKENGMIK